MKIDVVHQITTVFNTVYWDKLPQEYGEYLAKHPNALGRFFTDFFSGKIKFNPDDMVGDYEAGQVQIQRKKEE